VAVRRMTVSVPAVQHPDWRLISARRVAAEHESERCSHDVENANVERMREMKSWRLRRTAWMEQ